MDKQELINKLLTKGFLARLEDNEGLAIRIDDLTYVVWKETFAGISKIRYNLWDDEEIQCKYYSGGEIFECPEHGEKLWVAKQSTS